MGGRGSLTYSSSTLLNLNSPLSVKLTNPPLSCKVERPRGRCHTSQEGQTVLS